MKTSGLGVLFGLALALPVMASELTSASGVAATADDKCPMHARFEAAHKQGEPCPVGKNAGAMRDKCDVRKHQDCLEKGGKPCPVSKDACDTERRREKTVK